jgi:hypothetical protein
MLKARPPASNENILAHYTKLRIEIITNMSLMSAYERILPDLAILPMKIKSGTNGQKRSKTEK